MYPKQHLIFGGLLSIVLLIFFPQVGLIEVFLIILSNSLVDVDHYIYYVYKKKDWSLKNAHNWFTKRNQKFEKLSKKENQRYKRILLIFHGIEFWIILFFISLIFLPFYWILFGVMIHIVFDFSELLSNGISISGKISQVYTFIKNRNKKEFKF